VPDPVVGDPNASTPLKGGADIDASRLPDAADGGGVSMDQLVEGAGA